MPNDVLVNSILALTTKATPTETLVLKIAAALIKQIDQDYEIRKDTDPRIKISMEELDWLPGALEVWNGIRREGKQGTFRENRHRSFFEPRSSPWLEVVPESGQSSQPKSPSEDRRKRRCDCRWQRYRG